MAGRGKNKGHNQVGNYIQKERVEELEKENRKAQVKYYQVESPSFEVYQPKTYRKKRDRK